MRKWNRQRLLPEKWNDLKGCDAAMRANSQTLPERLAVVAGDNLKGPTVRISLAGVATVRPW